MHNQAWKSRGPFLCRPLRKKESTHIAITITNCANEKDDEKSLNAAKLFPITHTQQKQNTASDFEKKIASQKFYK